MSKMPPKTPKPPFLNPKNHKPSSFRFFLLILGCLVFFLIFFSDIQETNIRKLSYSELIAFSDGLYKIHNTENTKDTVQNIAQLMKKDSTSSTYKIYNTDKMITINESNKNQYKITPYRTIKSVKVKNHDKITGSFLNEKQGETRFVTSIPINSQIIDRLVDNGIDVHIVSPDQDNGIFNSLIGFLPWILMFFFIWFFFIRQVNNSNNKAFSFGKSKAKLYASDQKNKTTFADVAGNEEAKQELQEVIDFLKYPEKYIKMGAYIPKGILLSGPPGTGKTLLAKAVAGEADKPFYSIIASEFVEMFVGIGASRVRDLFSTAKKNAPCIIFIDELDAIGRMRGVGVGGGNDEKEQTLNQILSEMDGFEKESTIIVIAATNRPDILDAALLRPGRFDRQINIGIPSENDRLEILKLVIKNKPIDPDIDLESISKEISGFSGAEITNLVNEAILIATRKNKKLVDKEDFQEAQEKVSKQKNHNSTEPPTLFGRSRSRFYDKSSAQLKKFADVAGAYEAKQELIEVVDFLKKPDKYKKLGARIPKGILLSGPPGTGKTLLAKAIAGEANRPFFSASGSDFVEMYVGVGASRVRDLFNTARKNAPCIIFIDEIDAIGKQRAGGFGGGNDERDQTLNQILSEMDGFDSSNTVIVLASTNRPDILDPALLRPGRFDRQVSVEKPDIKSREEILNVHAKSKPLADDVDLRKLAHGTSGFTGAELENLLNEASLLAAREDQEIIYWKDIDNAKDKVLMGPEKRNLVMLQKEKINTAYHEAGHAIVAHYLDATDPVHKVTIIPRGRALGVTQQIPVDDKKGYTKEFILNRISILMAGRIAEEMKFGASQVTTGASNDIKVATQMAYSYVTEFGMSESLGMIYYDTREQSNSVKNSPETVRKIDEEVKKIIDSQYNTAYELLKKHEDKLIAMSDLLLTKETIDELDIENLLGIKPGIAEIKEEVEKEYEKIRSRLTLTPTNIEESINQNEVNSSEEE